MLLSSPTNAKLQHAPAPYNNNFMVSHKSQPHETMFKNQLSGQQGIRQGGMVGFSRQQTAQMMSKFNRQMESPRFVDAMKNLGVKKAELQFKTLKDFQQNGESTELA
jgi:hypothetical protein